MNPIVGASLISAGSTLVGGLLGKKSAKSSQNRDYQNQKEFAQHGIRWKVADAKAAGLHPLAALGANTQSYSPVIQTDPFPDAISQAGQQIGRGIAAQGEEYPTGPIVYPAGSKWPHYTGKNGSAIPFSADQMRQHMALQNAQSQLAVTEAQTDLYKAQAEDIRTPEQTPGFYTMFQMPDGTKIPFPNQLLGEVAEALAQRSIKGNWWYHLKTNYPEIAGRFEKHALEGYGKQFGSLLDDSPDLLEDMLKAFISQEGSQ